MIFSGNKYKQWVVAEYFGYILDLNVSEEPMTGRSPKKNNMTLQSIFREKYFLLTQD